MISKKMKNRVILNTRPISQSFQTCDAFEIHGFKVINFPCIEIVHSENNAKCTKQLDNINPECVVIFTSQQSVNYAFKLAPDWKISKSSTIIAIGTKTAEKLEQYIDNNIFSPELQNSQGVIDLLQGLKTPQEIVLISAANGRQQIQNYAKNNNIELTQINVYKRQVPTSNISLDWLEGDLNLCVLATSVAILKNLKVLLGENLWLKLQNQLIVCASSRIETYANNMGLNNTLNTKSANAEVMANKLSSL
jgi:uroporphyrinogen-III synthase